ncbi:MAG TPA: zf-TFIIB domain-containing protein [Actinomycetota bacterium]|nr:zf-TFIIB domain-containing protein [Actinomycetota bacterium]
MTTDLICPKCQGTMRSYERSGITVDQCADCRGIFLDRGELEHLVDAEQSWQRREPSQRERERDREIPFPRTFGDRDDDDDDDRYRGEEPRKRKRSFFDDLFD